MPVLKRIAMSLSPRKILTAATFRHYRDKGWARASVLRSIITCSLPPLDAIHLEFHPHRNLTFPFVMRRTRHFGPYPEFTPCFSPLSWCKSYLKSRSLPSALPLLIT